MAPPGPGRHPIGGRPRDDRSDPNRRLRLPETNAEVFAEIVPQWVAVAPGTVLMVVTTRRTRRPTSPGMWPDATGCPRPVR